MDWVLISAQSYSCRELLYWILRSSSVCKAEKGLGWNSLLPCILPSLLPSFILPSSSSLHFHGTHPVQSRQRQQLPLLPFFWWLSSRRRNRDHWFLFLVLYFTFSDTIGGGTGRDNQQCFFSPHHQRGLWTLFWADLWPTDTEEQILTYFIPIDCLLR